MLIGETAKANTNATRRTGESGAERIVPKGGFAYGEMCASASAPESASSAAPRAMGSPAPDDLGLDLSAQRSAQQQERQDPVKRQRTEGPVGIGALSLLLDAQAPLLAAPLTGRGDLHSVLIDFACFAAALRSQRKADVSALLLNLSLVSPRTLECVERASTQLCDVKHTDLLNALLPSTTRASMCVDKEVDAEVQDILWYETNQGGGKGGNKLLATGQHGGKRGQQWKFSPRMRVAHALWVSNGIIDLGPFLPFDCARAQQFYQEAFCEAGMKAKTYANRQGYAQVNLFQSTLANALEADGTGRPLLRFVLESLRQLQRITVPGTTIPAVVMGGGAGWLRCLALDRQRIESTGGAKAGGQHLDAAMSEPRQRRADEQATRLRQLPSVDQAEVRTFVRCTTTIGSDNGSQWISPSN